MLPPIEDSSDNDSPSEEPTILNPHSLFLKFPTRFNKDRTVAIDYIKSLHPKIVKVRLGRQKSSNFCHVDFDTQSDCDDACESLRNLKIQTEDTKTTGKLIVKLPRTPDSPKHINKLETIQAKRKQKKILNQLVIHIRNMLRKDPRKTVTNIIFTKNLPRKMTVKDMQQVFPDLVNVEFVQPKFPDAKTMVAYVTLPTPRDACLAVKKKHFFKDNKLAVSFVKLVQNLDSKEKRRFKREKREKKQKPDVHEGDLEIKQENLSDDDVEIKMEFE